MRIEKNVALLTRQRNGVKRLALDRAVKKGIVDYLDPTPTYYKHLDQFVDIVELRRQKLDVMVDPMYGAGIGYFKTILQNGNLKVSEINAERNPSFPQIQPEPIAKNLTNLSRLVVDQKADVGLATDGDADRIGILDEKGQFLTQHQVFALLCLYLLEIRGERGAMVRTLTSTMMINRLGQLFDVPVYETSVGFRYVAPLMMEKNAIIGGEESGGYGFRGHVPERDAILAGLYFLDFMVETGKAPSQLLEYLYSKVGPHYYNRRDFHIGAAKRQTILHGLSSSSPNAIAGIRVTSADITDGFRFFLSDDSWLLIRFSGTEPLVRIYSEAGSLERVEMLLDEGKKLIGL
jgi:phosphomannomutase